MTCHNYGQDVGALHILDRLLYLACKPWQDGTYGPREHWHWPHTLTHRYLDGEEERKGLYR